MIPVKSVVFFVTMAAGVSGCSSWQMASVPNPEPVVVMGKVAENEYEVRIYDEGFRKWFARNARPIKLHNQEYYEKMNNQYVTIWNEKAASNHFSLINSPVHTPINYDATIDYGLEIDYLLFNYFRYVEFRYGRLIKGPKAVPSIAETAMTDK